MKFLYKMLPQGSLDYKTLYYLIHESYTTWILSDFFTDDNLI